ncbi:MAG: hypothetical protein IJS85_04690 [Clostridiales bacterium]|nr:hypothetical protein [Clostridiales bacterium]
MNKKVLIIAGCAVGALALAGGITAAIILNTPESLLVRAAANTAKDIRNLEWYKLMDDVANGGSVEISANLAPVMEDGDDLYVDAKIYEDASKGNGALVVSALDEDKETIVSFNAAYDKNALTLSCPEADDEVYGFDLKNIEDNIEDSPFDPENYDPYDYSNYDSNSYKYAIFGQYIMNLGSNVEGDTKIQSMAEKLEEKYRNLFIKELVANSDVTKSSETVTCGSDKISCNVVTVEFDEEQLGDIMLNIIEYAQDDKELEEYIELLAANADNDNLDLADEFYDELDDLEDEIEEDMSDAELDFCAKFYISKSGTKFVKAEIEAEAVTSDEYYGEETSNVSISLELGKNLDGVGEKSLTVETEVTREGYNDSGLVELSYEIEQNDSNAYAATLTLSTEDSTSWDDGYDPYEHQNEFTFEFNWDKKSGDLTIEYESEKQEWQDSAPYFILEANMLDNGDTRTIILEDMKYESGYSYDYQEDDDPFDNIGDFEFTIVLDRNDKAPAPAKDFTELTELDEDEIDEILEDIDEEIEAIWEDMDYDF